MDTFAARVKTFDAFPKVDSQHTVRSSRGGLSTILTTVFVLFIAWIEVGGYLGGYVDHQFTVDDVVRRDLEINIDMLVAMPCEYLHTNAVDITNDRYLAGETLNFQGSEFFLPDQYAINSENARHQSPELDMVMRENYLAEFRVQGMRVNENAPACHIFGSFPVNHVSGEFFITAKGLGYRDRTATPPHLLNFSHVIAEFSFGQFYPLINNPLDFTGKTTSEKFQSYKYYTKVVPTIYKKLGIEIDTNQYAVTEQHKAEAASSDGMPKQPPGIYFKYRIEPVKLVIAEERIPFIQFVARLATILGGLMICAGYLFRLYEKLVALAFGKKYASKDTEKLEGGLLEK